MYFFDFVFDRLDKRLNLTTVRNMLGNLPFENCEKESVVRTLIIYILLQGGKVPNIPVKMTGM